MDVLFLEAPYSGTVELCPETLNYLAKKRYKTVALYASIQFCTNLDKVKDQLQTANITIITSQPDRTHLPGQLLGCDNYHSSLQLSAEQWKEIDCFLYIGDGKFHPYALLYAQKDFPVTKEVMCNDPLQKKFQIFSIDDITKILKKYRGTLLKFLSSRNIGVLITVKPGQEQLKPAFFLEKKFPEKKFYYFVDDTISFNQLENFPFIEAWINTACPRIGLDDQEQFRKGVLNLNEALRAEELVRNI